MKYIIIFLLSISSLLGKITNVDIQAEFFDSNESKNIVIFRGNVSMIKGKDTIKAQEIILKSKLNEKTNKKDIISYVATGDVSFKIKTQKEQLIGRGEKIIYDIKNKLYVISGNGYIEDILNNKLIQGENIYINQKTGHTRVDGSKKYPVKFKFTIEE